MSQALKGLKKLRLRAELTQEELAEVMGVDVQTVRNYEHGRREPDLRGLRDLSNILSSSVEELMEE